MTTVQPRESYRHRNSKQSSMSPDRIHTFWVGQRVVRAGHERKAYIDLIAETGTVVELPKKGDPREYLQVEVDGVARPWTVFECMPRMVWAQRQAKRLRAVAKDYADYAARLDRDGFTPKELNA